MLMSGFKKWPTHQKIILPILVVLGFGMLVNETQIREPKPVNLLVSNPEIVDGDTFRIDGRRYRLIGMDAPDSDGNGDVLKTAAGLYLEELVRQNGPMDCTSTFLDKPLAAEGICRQNRSSWGRMNLSCRFRSNGASVGATMVRHGYAVDFRQHSGLAYAALMKDAAREARGLWGVDYRAMRQLAIERGRLPESCEK